MVNVKDPTVSLSKCRRTIAGTMAKFQIPALTYKGHCIRDTAVPSANYANCSHVLHIKEKEGWKNEQNVHLTMLTTESSRQEADVIFPPLTLCRSKRAFWEFMFRQLTLFFLMKC